MPWPGPATYRPAPPVTLVIRKSDMPAALAKWQAVSAERVPVRPTTIGVTMQVTVSTRAPGTASTAAWKTDMSSTVCR